ncbi:MAG: YbaK/EbsC family protein [Coriobacteriia bacterium]
MSMSGPTPITDGAARARRVLERHGLAAGVRSFDRSTKTAQAAAEAVGCELGQIAKSIVFVADGRPVLAVVAGDRRGDAVAIAAEAGAVTARLADPATVLAMTGYTVGSVSPFDLPADVTVLVDESLGRFDVVLPAAGTADSVVSVPLDSLVALAGGRMAPISR